MINKSSSLEQKQEDFRIGEYLINQGLVDEKAVHTALEQQNISGELLGDILVSNGFISQKQKIDALRVVNVEQLAFENTLVTRCPSHALIETQSMIFVEDDNEVYIASLQRKEDVIKRLREYYSDQVFKWMPLDIEALDNYTDNLVKISGNLSEHNRLDWLVKTGLLISASDLHIQPRAKSYSVFMRVDGRLLHRYEGTLDEYKRVLSQIKEKSNIDPAEKRIPQDGGFQISHNGRGVDLRVATGPTVDGEKVVIRILDPSNTVTDIKNIGISRVSEWKKGTSEIDGICLICGPTGSGKTTTLNATIQSMDRFVRAIYTIEDPVEYRIPYISQMNVNEAVKFDFAKGLKAMMRMDPDIITVGEIRDIETAETAIKAAETGHMVLGTLHTGSISGALERLRDIGVDPGDIKNLIRSIMVQRLIRKVCPECKGDKCSHCNETGYKGRALISEVVYFEDSAQVMKAYNGEISWPTLIDDAIEKYKNGITTKEEVLSLGEKARIAMENAERGSCV